MTDNGRLTLLSEDPGGEPLLRLLGRPWEITSFLRFAIGLAAALARLHGRGLIHKDIKPANILVNNATWTVWLTGFGIASHLPRERQAPGSTEAIVGTLAYMAPEQTSAAISTPAASPFARQSPDRSHSLHPIHRNGSIATSRPPAPPSERVHGIPGPIEAVILKLLAKSPEDRFQTAAGLEADLRACLASWETHRRIDALPIGTRDVPDRLLNPEKLNGRKAEVEVSRCGVRSRRRNPDLCATMDVVTALSSPKLHSSVLTRFPRRSRR